MNFNQKLELLKAGKAELVRADGYLYFQTETRRVKIKPSTWRALGGSWVFKDPKKLTEKQTEVIEYLKQGLGIGRIAKRMGVCDRAITKHIRLICMKWEITGGTVALRERVMNE